MAQAQVAERPAGAARVPQKRRTNAVASMDKLTGQRPDMKYILVSESQKGSHGVEHYEMLGYSICTKEKGGCELLAGAKARPIGAPSKVFGMVLMQIPLQDWKDMQDQGQEFCDDIEGRLRDRKADIREATAGISMTTRGGDEAFSLTDEKE
jgi:hypothetical protein